MTTFEHAMLGVNGALAAGLHRQFGWQAAAIAGVAAVAPDWDGIPIIFSVTVFDAVHRLWGHNVFACLATGCLIGFADYRFDLLTRLAKRAHRRFPRIVEKADWQLRQDRNTVGLATWISVASLAALSQIPADMVVSGTATLNDWELKPFWPLWHQGWVFPLVPWGDVGVTVIFAAGMFALLRWKSATQSVAGATLAAVALYIALRGIL